MGHHSVFKRKGHRFAARKRVKTSIWNMGCCAEALGKPRQPKRQPSRPATLAKSLNFQAFLRLLTLFRARCRDMRSGQVKRGRKVSASGGIAGVDAGALLLFSVRAQIAAMCVMRPMPGTGERRIVTSWS